MTDQQSQKNTRENTVETNHNYSRPEIRVRPEQLKEPKSPAFAKVIHIFLDLIRLDVEDAQELAEIDQVIEIMERMEALK